MEPLVAYEQLLGRLDAFFARAQVRAGAELRCGPGCAECCAHDLSLFPVEVERMVQAATRLPGPIRSAVLARALRAAADAEAPCPLLGEAGRCSIYSVRPVICRTHGLPLLLPRGEGPPELSLCALNFRGAARLAGDAVLDLGPVNAVLAAVNHLWCQARGRSPERVRVAVAVAEALGALGPVETPGAP